PLSPARRARARRQFEPQRSLAATDAALPAGEDLVGTTGAYSLRMSVPGALLPVAGVTAVSVLPSHRRRGVLRSLMHRQLADIAARGEEPVAALWASETPIYGRYGYGCAAMPLLLLGGRGARGHRRAAARQRGPVAAAGRRLRIGGLRADGRSGRPRDRRP